MNQKTFSQIFLSPSRENKLFRSALSLLLVMALLLAGCSAPANSGSTSASNSQDMQTSSGSDKDDSNFAETENNDSSELEHDDSSESNHGGSQEADDSQEGGFDFNQPLDLKKPEPAAGEQPRILFVGNSHTYTNDLPSIFRQVAEAMGHGSDVQELTEGSYTLTQFADTADELGSVLNQKLTEETWDFVVLQENTNDAFSFPEENMFPAAQILDEKIKGAGGQTAVLMTWSPKDGASIFSLEDVQAILAQNTIQVSNQLNSLLIPGGIAFMRCLEQYPEIELWGEDGMHPSVAGSYLAACTAYAVFFQESPAGCSYTADLEPETAARLQTLAAEFL